MEMSERREWQTKKLIGCWGRNRMPNVQEIWGTAASYQRQRICPMVDLQRRRIRLRTVTVHSERAWCKESHTAGRGVGYYLIRRHNVMDAVGMGRLCEFIEGPSTPSVVISTKWLWVP